MIDYIQSKEGKKIRINVESCVVSSTDTTRGWNTYVVFEAEESDDGSYHVYTWDCIGSGTPGLVWHGRAKMFGIPCNSWGPDVGAKIEHLAEDGTIDALIDSYEGAEWDGHNMRGHWTNENSPYDSDADSRIEREFSDVATVVDPADFLGDTASEIRRDLENGMTPEEILSNMDPTDGYVSCGDELMCDEDEMMTWLIQEAEEMGITEKIREIFRIPQNLLSVDPYTLRDLGEGVRDGMSVMKLVHKDGRTDLLLFDTDDGDFEDFLRGFLDDDGIARSDVTTIDVTPL